MRFNSHTVGDSGNVDLQNWCKENLRVNYPYHNGKYTADLNIKTIWTHESNPTPWELI